MSPYDQGVKLAMELAGLKKEAFPGAGMLTRAAEGVGKALPRFGGAVGEGFSGIGHMAGAAMQGAAHGQGIMHPAAAAFGRMAPGMQNNVMRVGAGLGTAGLAGAYGLGHATAPKPTLMDQVKSTGNQLYNRASSFLGM